MKLTDLNAKFLSSGGEGIFDKDMNPVPETKGVGLVCDCPCGGSDSCSGKLAVEFSNPLSGGPPTRVDGHTWHRVGETIETLTLTPSIQRVGGCGWHGFITNGEAVKC